MVVGMSRTVTLGTRSVWELLSGDVTDAGVGVHLVCELCVADRESGWSELTTYCGIENCSLDGFVSEGDRKVYCIECVRVGRTGGCTREHSTPGNRTERVGEPERVVPIDSLNLFRNMSPMPVDREE
jgi:hypothetical protein